MIDAGRPTQTRGQHLAGTKRLRATYLRLASLVFATIFIGFGINALANPAGGVSFFGLQYPKSLSKDEPRLVDVLMNVWAVREIIVGLVIYVAAILGDRRALGLITILAGVMVAADGLICRLMVGKGEFYHVLFAPVVVTVGALVAVG